MFERIRLRENSVFAKWLAVLLAMVLCITFLPRLSAAKAEENRQETTCMNLPNDMTCSEDMLSQMIRDAGSTPTQIHLGATDTMLTRTLVIPAGADVELVDGTKYKDWFGDGRLNREDGFTGTMVHVEKGAKLTLSGTQGADMLIVSRGEWVPSSSPVVLVQGEMVLNDGSSISGARGLSGSNVGAVTVTNGGLLTMNGGEITDNWRRQDPGSTQYGAGNVAVSNGGKLVMNGGEITHGRGSATSGASYGEAGGIRVGEGGTAEINGGKISENQGWAGGILLMRWLWSPSLEELEKEKEAGFVNRARLVVNGGEISNNQAGFGGAAISLFGDTEATMNGGKIAGNSAPNGGGVNAMDTNVFGGAYPGDKKPGENQKAKLSDQEWGEYVPAAFTMNGGEIVNNTASNTGGGVNVVSNRVVLNAGLIEGNYAPQGGGVYVATATYTAHINNALLTENSSSYIGGGIWSCPTGSVKINMNKGVAVLADNKAKRYGDAIAHDNYGSAGSPEFKLEPRMLGGGKIDWFDDGGDPQKPRYDAANPGDNHAGKTIKLSNAGMISDYTDDSKATAHKDAKLIIRKNTAQRGGGVGTNGNVVFGEEGGTFDVDLTKNWVFAEGFNNTSIGGYNSPDALAKLTKDKVIDLELVRVNGSDEFVLEKAEMSAKTDWKASFKRLLAKDSDGNPITYKIRENIGTADKPEYKYTDAFTANDQLEKISTSLSNEINPETVSVSLSKQWVDHEGTPLADDKIPVADVSFQLFAAIKDGEKIKVSDPVKLNAANGWAHEFTGLPKSDVDGNEITYTVEETALDGFTSEVAYEKTDAGLVVKAKNTKAKPTPTPTPTPPPTPSETPPPPAITPTPTPSKPPIPGLPRTGDGSGMVALLGLAALTATALVARRKN